MVRRAVVPVWPLVFSFALLGSLGATPALADAPPDVAPPSDKTAAKPRPGAGSPARPAAAAADDPAAAQGVDQGQPSDEPPPEISERGKKLLAIKWQEGPVTGSLGDIAEVNVPEGLVFADGEGTRSFLELNENPTNGSELGMVAAADFSWVATFEFSDIGYVKDEEKAELDADEILSSLRDGNEAGNKVRKERGWGTVTLLGWAQPPRYDQTTNNLEWSTKIEDDKDKHVTINHNIRLLGRSGVMEVSLMSGPDDYAAALPSAKKVLDGYSFKTGQKYSEWRQGDKIAAIGLTGLITGGAIAAAAKTGLLAKMGKGVFKLIAVVGAGAAAAVSKLFGRKKEND